MEANEAPKKIYVDFFNTDMWSISIVNDGNPEYTRTDAFIEKACEYLNNTCRRFILTEKDIEDFKNYMKGE